MMEKLKIKTYKAEKGETIIHILIALAEEMVTIKNKINEIIEIINKLDKKEKYLFKPGVTQLPERRKVLSTEEINHIKELKGGE